MTGPAVVTDVAAPDAPPTDWADDLAFALELAGRAGAVLMDHYERLEQIDYKSARDVVTEADHLSEALILDAIRARYPADAILAEETGEHRAIAGEAPTSGRGRVWIVDPLDGTVNYANGLPVFCVSIGLVVDGVPTVGVILDPTRDDVFAATVDGPATLDGRPVRTSDKDKLSDFVISMALNGRTAPTPRPQRAQGDPHLALDGLGRARARVRRQRPVRRVHPAGRAVRLGRRGGRADRRAGRGHGHLADRRPVVRRGAKTAHDRHPRRAGRAPRDAARRSSARRVGRSGTGPVPAIASQRCGRPASRAEAPLLAERLPLGPRRPVPAQLVGVVLADDDAVVGGPEPGEVAVEDRLVPVVAQRGRERHRPRAADPGHLPGRRLGRDVLVVAVAGQHRRRRTSTPQPGSPGKPSEVVADEPEVVRDRGRRHAPLRADPGVVVDEVAAPIPQHDPLVADELGHVLVGRADQDPLDARIGAEPRRPPRRSRRRPRTRPSATATMPSASTAASAIGNWASSSGGIPADDL